MSSNTRQLLSKLKTSLPKIDESSVAQGTTHVFPTATTEKAARGNRAPKLSVSLYQHDIDRLEGIKDFMKSQGFRNLSDSEALRLACRKVAIDGTLVEVYRSMQQEDGRRR